MVRAGDREALHTPTLKIGLSQPVPPQPCRRLEVVAVLSLGSLGLCLAAGAQTVGACGGTWALSWSWSFSLNRENPILILCYTRNHMILYLFTKIFRIYPFYPFSESGEGIKFVQ